MGVEVGQTLQVRQEIGNLQDPFAIFLAAKQTGKFTDFDVVGHIPLEMSHFCHYFFYYFWK